MLYKEGSLVQWVSKTYFDESFTAEFDFYGGSELTWAITKMKNTSFQVLLCSETPEINVVPITKSLHPHEEEEEEEEGEDN